MLSGRSMSIMRGVYGKYWWSAYVWVRQPATNAKVWPKIDFTLKDGTPSNPKLWFEFLAAYWDPNPTNKPAIINLNGDVFSVYFYLSNG